MKLRVEIEQVDRLIRLQFFGLLIQYAIFSINPFPQDFVYLNYLKRVVTHSHIEGSERDFSKEQLKVVEDIVLNQVRIGCLLFNMMNQNSTTELTSEDELILKLWISDTIGLGSVQYSDYSKKEFDRYIRMRKNIFLLINHHNPTQQIGHSIGRFHYDIQPTEEGSSLLIYDVFDHTRPSKNAGPFSIVEGIRDQFNRDDIRGVIGGFIPFFEGFEVKVSIPVDGEIVKLYHTLGFEPISPQKKDQLRRSRRYLVIESLLNDYDFNTRLLKDYSEEQIELFGSTINEVFLELSEQGWSNYELERLRLSNIPQQTVLQWIEQNSMIQAEDRGRVVRELVHTLQKTPESEIENKIDLEFQRIAGVWLE